MASLPAVSFGQYYSPPRFSVTPSVINQGECYVISIPNWAPSYNGWGNGYLNILYETEWTGPQYIYWWPQLDWNGNALICTNSDTVPGQYRFLQVSTVMHWSWYWVTPASVTVNPPVPPPQPQPPLTFSAGQGYAGNDCYTLGVGNGANMTIDLSYQFNSVQQPTWSMALNGSGQWPYCLNHYDNVGSYAFWLMKNHLRSDWYGTSTSPPVGYTVKAPQPKWLTITPAVITQGQSYNIIAGNGGNVQLDIKRTLNGSAETVFGWPTLGTYGAPNPDGPLTIGTDGATPPGKYLYTALRNKLNSLESEWVNLQTPAPLTVCPSSPPAITGITPNNGIQATAVSVTITGANLCSVSLSTTATGLTISNVMWNAPFTSVTAAFTITSTAALGSATIQLTTPAGSTATTFGITLPMSLTRGYIYLGPRVIATEAP